MSIKQGRSAIIPSILTDSRATVKLVKTPEYELVKEPERELPVDEGLTYHPHIGFRIRYPTNVFNGLFRCDATLGNISESLNVALMFKGKSLAVHTSTHIHTHKHTHIHTDARAHARTHARTHTHIHTHTHTIETGI